MIGCSMRSLTSNFLRTAAQYPVVVYSLVFTADPLQLEPIVDEAKKFRVFLGHSVRHRVAGISADRRHAVVGEEERPRRPRLGADQKTAQVPGSCLKNVL